MMLRKVILLIEEDILQQKVLCGESILPDDLREHGVEIVIGQGQSVVVDIEVEENAATCNSTECYRAKCSEAEGIAEVCVSVEGGTEEHLYITDSEDTYRLLRQRGRYVLPYRHENNQTADFTGALYVIEQIEEVDYETVDLAYRRLAGLPWEILRTKRCIIRETTEADVDSFYNIYAEPEITRYMEDLYEDREEELAYVAEYREKMYGFYGYGMWTVLTKEGTVIGRAGISWREGFNLPELGFVIGVPWQGQGYAYEVCRAILDYAREELGFTQVQALVMEGNEKSAALCRKLGFRKGERVEEDGEQYDRYLAELT
ncbi:MAG: GNAT family N-acetyltransferase [Lachnospiraceae bacterium]|nr:GNAT family N-acetyltransferase [Lachnospiraceae bacterium]